MTSPLPKERRIRNPKYMETVRELPCLACRHPWNIDAHHVRIAQASSTGMKVGDNWVVPLCRPCHTELHTHGDEGDFWLGVDRDPLKWAENNWKEYKNG